MPNIAQILQDILISTPHIDLVLDLAEVGRCSVVSLRGIVFIACPDGSILFAAGTPTGEETEDLVEFDLRSGTFPTIQSFIQFILNPTAEDDPLAQEMLDSLDPSIKEIFVSSAMRVVSSLMEPGHA